MFAVLGQPWRNRVRQCAENSDKTGGSPRAQAQCSGAGEGLVRSCREHRWPGKGTGAERRCGTETGAGVASADEGRCAGRAGVRNGGGVGPWHVLCSLHLLSCPKNVLLREGEKENHAHNCFTMSKLLFQFSKASGQ